MAENRGCGPEAKAILAAGGTLIAGLVMTGIILAAIDILTGKRVDGLLITVMAVIVLLLSNWVYKLVRRRSSMDPNQLTNTPPGFPENVEADLKQVEIKRKDPEKSIAFRLGRSIRKMLNGKQ